MAKKAIKWIAHIYGEKKGRCDVSNIVHVSRTEASIFDVSKLDEADHFKYLFVQYLCIQTVGETFSDNPNVARKSFQMVLFTWQSCWLVGVVMIS